MGQGTSRPEHGSSADRQQPARPRTFSDRPVAASNPPPADAVRPRQSHRHSSFFSSFTPTPDRAESTSHNLARQTTAARRRSRLSRSHTSFTTSIPNFFHRHAAQPSVVRRPSRAMSPSPEPRQPSSSQPMNPPASSAPQLQIPPFDDSLNIPSLNSDSPLPTDFSWRHSPNSPDDRLPLGPDRALRGMTASLRRRRSPLPRNEDTSAMLTRLLSAAAAATALSLTGGSPETSINDLHNAVSNGIDGDDGSFNGFLQSLRNGRLASTLGQGPSQDADSDGVQDPPASLEFFRMFRFGSSNPTRRRNGRSGSRPASSRSVEPSSSVPVEGSGETPDEDRLIPVLIVGIRALNDRDANEERADGMPSFLDSLASAPTSVSMGSAEDAGTGETEASASEGRRSRRTTIGGFNFFSHDRTGARHDERSRPATSYASPSESPPGPHPPPTTPASPGLSAFSSGATTPTRRSSMSSTADASGTHSRRDSLYRRLTGTTLEPTIEEQDQGQARPRGLRRRPRIHSWADGPRHDPRRNGVLMEPSEGTPSEGSSTRSWIIYILGGNYPENHPILTTPSLFTDSPTYEDMLLLSNLLGSAKPPVANAEDVVSAGGLYKVSIADDSVTLQEIDGEDRFEMSVNDRCLVCLSEYLEEEEIRRLAKCKHVFHKECIDQWLTTGRNSCPLCRSQGVDEKKRPSGGTGESDETPASTSTTAASS